MRLAKGRGIPDGWSDDDIEKAHEEYFRRLWYNQERTYVDT
jgi:hypothetical protein